MKRKFVITEVASYTVEAETIGKAEERFREVDDVNRFPCDVSGREIEAPDPNPVKVGDQVNIDAHYGHDEDFSGIVVANDGLINGSIKVEAPDGEVYDCDANYVYVPGAVEAAKVDSFWRKPAPASDQVTEADRELLRELANADEE